MPKCIHYCYRQGIIKSDQCRASKTATPIHMASLSHAPLSSQIGQVLASNSLQLVITIEQYPKGCVAHLLILRLPPIACIYSSPCPCFYNETSIRFYSSPRLARTFALHLFRNSFGSSRHNLAASTFAGLSSFGLLSILMTLSSIVSGVCTGDHLSAADS